MAVLYSQLYLTINRLLAQNIKNMLISEFIQQLQDLCDNEGDMEIVMITDSNSFGSEPHLRKSSFYDQFEITNH